MQIWWTVTFPKYSAPMPLIVSDETHFTTDANADENC